MRLRLLEGNTGIISLRAAAAQRMIMMRRGSFFKRKRSITAAVMIYPADMAIFKIVRSKFSISVLLRIYPVFFFIAGYHFFYRGYVFLRQLLFGGEGRYEGGKGPSEGAFHELLAFE